MDITYENDKTRQAAEQAGFISVVPPINRKSPWSYDTELYKRHNEVERLFLSIKRFRKVFTCYNKFEVIYLSVVTFAMILDAAFNVNRL